MPFKQHLKTQSNTDLYCKEEVRKLSTIINKILIRDIT